ncbi:MULTISPECIES: hypothetical protein [Pseudomonas]|uniref:hypothetical protein n=1 Tax=Pseudomonas TaxID=286 RepID=UPI000D20803A|nr:MULTISPECIES: hypothetical protein [Pseudomonas]AVZ17440.1 hypothetical protein DBA97_03650 [Pseudomonas aeruginosa]HBO3178477.1 hypothetical protein [Pseudomonas aeruginosa]HEN8625871.1 hypothetical protein [Pseudomonas aeruginosa]HEN8630598.1 hypothetical protein [Pseudomonas aeruginosa]HEN8809038.1 hypothetical protein [Pseudomonas aeruginosa]
MTNEIVPLSVKESQVVLSQRPLSGGSAVEMGWSIPESDEGPLLAGFAKWDGDNSPYKTLNYDEVLLVLEGTFGFQVEDGERFEGGPNTTLRIPKYTRVKYFGSNAKVFFVITPPCE